MKRLLFDIHERSTGRTFRIWSNGELEGFADDALIANHAAPLLDMHEGTLIKIKSSLAEASSIVDRAQAILSDPSLSGVGTEPFCGMLQQLPIVPVKGTE